MINFGIDCSNIELESNYVIAVLTFKYFIARFSFRFCDTGQTWFTIFFFFFYFRKIKINLVFFERHQVRFDG